MPIYYFKCQGCDNTFEEFLSIADRDSPTETPCAICGDEIHREIGATPNIWKCSLPTSPANKN